MKKTDESEKILKTATELINFVNFIIDKYPKSFAKLWASYKKQQNENK